MTAISAETQANTILLTSFFVRESLCALDAVGVQEVIRVDSITSVRHAPSYVAGVINLRGKIVTIIDLGMKFGSGKSVITRDTRIFIIEDRGEYLGILVDRVGEVFEIEAGQETALPVNIPAVQARYFRGICRAGGHVIALLNPSEVLNETIA